MKGIIKIQGRKPVLVVCAYLLLIVLVWVGSGRRGFNWPRESRLLAILIVLFLGVLLLFFKAIKANRNAASLERSIKMQAEDQMRSTRPEKKEEIEELERELLLAIESLKKSKLGRGRSGRSALYSLPWYMFIGPPAAGKTTAIINSGLEFSFGADIKGVGGTRNCDWFFSNSAIILDTAGRYVTEDEDKEEWLGFLDILRKHRRRSPINGVIIGMSIAEILKSSPDEIEWHAKNIRRRIDELIQRLGIRFPVYLVFTKLDLLQGFVEMFEHLSRAEREQIWGCSLAPDEASSAKPREVFEQEFDILIRALDDFRLKRLSLSAKPESRGRVYVFPLEFAGIKDSLWQFIGKLFQPSPYQEVPIFRGFYFTSGTQEGVPIDRVIQAIAKQFELPSEMISEPEIQKKSYFIRRLFTDIIVPDRSLVSQTSRAATQRSLLRAGVTVGSLILLGAFIFGVSQGFVGSRSKLRSVQGEVDKLKVVDWTQGVPLIDNLRTLDGFQKSLVSIEKNETRWPIKWSGMSRTGKVLEAARKLYFEKCRPFVNNSFYQKLESRLRDWRNYRGYAIKDYLTAYLLMGSPESQLHLHEERYLDLLKKQLLSLYTEQTPANGAGEELELIKGQLDYFVDCLSLGREDMPPFENDGDLVQFIRALLNKPPDLEDVYRGLVRDGLDKYQQNVSLSQILRGEDLNLVFIANDLEVPELFTRGGWESYVKQAIEQYSQNPEKENWILGQTQRQGPGVRDPKTLSDGLTRLYFQEYSRRWWQFLQGIQYTRFRDLSSASARLKRLSDPKQSPLRLIIDKVAQETRFGAEEASRAGMTRFAGEAKKIGQKIGGTQEPPKASPKSFVESGDFAKIQALSPPAGGEGEGSKELSNLLQQYALLDEKLSSIKESPGPEAKKMAASVLRDEGELPEALKIIRTSFPEPDFDGQARVALFEQPLINVWEVILSEARNGLNDVWRNDVYQPYMDNLASYYPFDRQAKEDAPLAEVTRFFNPKEGPIGKFINDELTSFVKLDKTNLWEPIRWMDKGLSLPAGTITALERASAISQALFEQGGLQVSFSVLADFPQPIGIADEKTKKEIRASVEEITLDIDGQIYPYKMGLPLAQRFSWPGTAGPLGARLTIVPNKSSKNKSQYQPLKAEGTWGWFRLLDKAEIQERLPTEYSIGWLFGLPNVNQIRVRYTLKTTTLSNPFRPPIKEFFHLPLPQILIPDGGGD